MKSGRDSPKPSGRGATRRRILPLMNAVRSTTGDSNMQTRTILKGRPAGAPTGDEPTSYSGRPTFLKRIQVGAGGFSSIPQGPRLNFLPRFGPTGIFLV